MYLINQGEIGKSLQSFKVEQKQKKNFDRLYENVFNKAENEKNNYLKNPPYVRK